MPVLFPSLTFTVGTINWMTSDVNDSEPPDLTVIQLSQRNVEHRLTTPYN